MRLRTRPQPLTKAEELAVLTVALTMGVLALGVEVAKGVDRWVRWQASKKVA